VIIDDPTVGSRMGAATSAPVFQEVAQQALEYLGVPHDQPFNLAKKTNTPRPPIAEDAVSEEPGDLNALFSEVNSLPVDDPLRQQETSANVSAIVPPPTPAPAKRGVFSSLPDKIVAAFKAHGGLSMTPDTEETKPLPKSIPQTRTRPDGAVVVSASQKVAVPVFVGASLRTVVEHARGAGLRVQPVGSGLATEQVPSAGTMVPIGTEVIVRFAR
jgi:cell division protein FtsI (penicillin-binding protein 3)